MHNCKKTSLCKSSKLRKPEIGETAALGFGADLVRDGQQVESSDTGDSGVTHRVTVVTLHIILSESVTLSFRINY